MYCKNCETLNKKNQKFCTKCGKKLTKENIKEISKKEEVKLKGKAVKEKVVNSKVVKEGTKKFNSLPKKFKILVLAGIVLVIGLIIALFIVLNNPVKKIEKNFNEYYETGNSSYLSEIDDVVYKYSDNGDKSEKLRNKAEDIIYDWVEIFNDDKMTSAKLDNEYEKLSSALTGIGSYFDGAYIIDYDYLTGVKKLASDLYSSKMDYFNGKDSDNEVDKYNYYSKVIEEDVFYEEAQKFINEYLKKETDKLISEVEKLKVDNETASLEDKDRSVRSILNYLNTNKIVNNIDLSTTEVYKELLDKAISDMANINLEIAKSKVIVSEETTSNDALNIYKSAIDYLNLNDWVEGIEIKSKDIDAYKEEIGTKIYEVVNSIAKEYIEKYNYEELLVLLNESLNYVNEEAKTELNNLINDYKEKGPFDLIELGVSDASYHYGITSYKREINGVSYKNNISLGVDSGTQFVEYNLEKKYNHFKAEVVRPSTWHSSTKAKVIVYGDGKELFNSGNITRANEYKNIIDIDVTDVSVIKISVQGSSSKYRSLHVANAALYLK